MGHPDTVNPYVEGYEMGSRQAWLSMLMQCIGALGYPIPPDDDPARAVERARWVLERERAVAALRDVCAEHGDNDWADNLSLADAIEKHLLRHLEKGSSNAR